MKLTFIGVGSAFSLKNLHSNMLLETSVNVDDDGNEIKRLLIDCGGTAQQALSELGLNSFDIDDLYISHQHADHMGGMEWFCFSRYFGQSNKQLPELYINEYLADSLWNNSLRGGMRSHQGTLFELDSYFSKVHRIGRNGNFSWYGYELQTVKTPSYGMFIKTDNGKLFITTDTQFSTELIDNYKCSEIIFQDCETYDWQSKTPRKSGVHAHYSDLVTLAESIKKKMWLYRYQDGPLPDAVSAGFAGFIVKGQSFSFDLD